MNITCENLKSVWLRWDKLGDEKAVQVAGFSTAALQLLVGHLAAQQSRRVIICLPHQRDFAIWSDFLRSLSDSFSSQLRVAILPKSVAWGSDRLLNTDAVKRQRLDALALLAHQDSGIVLSTWSGLSQMTLPSKSFRAHSQVWTTGNEVNQDWLANGLVELGYTPTNTVEETGRFALRGGIIDVFPAGRNFPVRIELFGDEIISIREFSIDSQRSLGTIDAVTVVPAAEAIFAESQRDAVAQKLYDRWIADSINPYDRDGMLRSFRDGLGFAAFSMYAPIIRDASSCALGYLRSDDLVIFPKSQVNCLESTKQFLQESDVAYAVDMANGRPVIRPNEHYAALEDSEAQLQMTRVLEVGNPYHDTAIPKLILHSPALPVVTGKGQQLFEGWCEVLRHKPATILCQNQEQVDRIINIFSHRGIQATAVTDALNRVLHAEGAGPSLAVGLGEVGGLGWSFSGHSLVIPQEIILGRKQIRRKSSSQKLKNFLTSFKELKIGGLVVHEEHGIGRYCGLANLEVAGTKGDFLILEYAGHDRVYLPVDRLNLLQKYNAGGDGNSQVALDNLKSLNWQRRKSRVKKAVREMAEQLLKVQAQRALSQGIPYGPVDEDYLRFESDFPYSETEDQKRAIADVNTDMTEPRPMDRLVCGDVGFGKTEIALRAAFRAVTNGYQVLVLVPTTVLCYQHFRTFQNRMEKFGVVVGQVNRFVKGQQLVAALQGLSDGKVDVLIGTHRLLSKDVKARKLGLLIVDEEQRFGVAHKEKIKEMQASCDVLTLTATPIPRTLHMAMLGLRDISIIATPPQDRLSVRTYVAEKDDALVRDAIVNEVSRGGQVFFVHNQVEDILDVQRYLEGLCPKVSIRHAHGQMSEQRLEQVIIDFIEQKFSVLLCTTIIEAGIDMPNVNTLIVDRSDRFGLAQLYQIRGRVGRSSRQAFAYFLTPIREQISDEARKRLDVLSAHQELGAGFQIASHDLEIRGAGNLLGAQQSGKVGEVGLEMYTDLLDEAIRELRGEPVTQMIDPEIKISFSAIISEKYIADEGLRLELYKRIFSVEEQDALRALKLETIDRFGPLPDETDVLFGVAKLKQILRICRAKTIGMGRQGAVDLRFSELGESQIDTLLACSKDHPETYALAPDYRLQIFIKSSWERSIVSQKRWLEALMAALDPIAHAFEEVS